MTSLTVSIVHYIEVFLHTNPQTKHIKCAADIPIDWHTSCWYVSGSEAELLHQLRTLTHCYSQLCDAVEKANSFYDFQLLPAFISGFIHNISSIYFLLKINTTNGLADLAIQVIWVLTHIVYMVLLVLPATAVLETVSMVSSLYYQFYFTLDQSCHFCLLRYKVKSNL